MYCPSCDKSYGAIHSRCPECHSWLKVSAPSRSKGAKSASSAHPSPSAPAPDKGGSVSTMDREPESSGISWADPSPKGQGSWADADSGGWDTSDISSSNGGSSWSSSEPEDGGWSGADSGSSWGGGTPAAAASAAPQAPPASKPSKGGGGSGWLAGDDANDGWSTGGLNGGGGSSQSASAAPAPQSNGWLGGGGEEAPSSSASNNGPSTTGWLSSSGGEDHEPQAGRGWLGDPQTEAKSGGASGGGGNGWLGDAPSDGPTMTEMVDQAINVEEDDEFVDDSWVDEEIRDNEFDDLEIPEYVAPAPEVGGTFLKMLLVAALVLLVGGGIIFLKSDSKSPEEKKAEEREKQIAFAVGAIAGGDKDMEAGKAELAIYQFEEALVALSKVKAPQAEIDSAELKLCKAMMKAGEYEKAIEHWKNLKSSPDEAIAKKAKDGMAGATRAKRLEANSFLKQAKTEANSGGTHSVRGLAKEALDIYQQFDGSRTQIGDSYGVIGRGFLNATDYGPAEQNLKKAVKFAPKLGYQKYLAKVRAKTRPVQTYRPATKVRRAPARPPTFDAGGVNYKTNNTRYSAGRRRNTRSSGSSTAAPAQKAPKKMKEIPIYRPKRNNGGGRKGSKGVLNSY